ncbi:MAG: hypothetical protein PUD92_05340 [Clostridiales bacterium]|nr:hypothetical protein [Clostridiales bacterium]
MILQIPAPPELTGNAAEDVAALREWCCTLNRQLRYIIAAHDDDIRTAGAAIGSITANTAETKENEV